MIAKKYRNGKKNRDMKKKKTWMGLGQQEWYRLQMEMEKK